MLARNPDLCVLHWANKQNCPETFCEHPRETYENS